jgi:hypothetical protein
LIASIADKRVDLAKADLHPATTIFITLPSSSLHYFVAKVTPQGIAFELLKLARVQMDSGIGTKLVVGDRTPMDLAKMRERRKERLGKRERPGEGEAEMDEGKVEAPAASGDVELSRWVCRTGFRISADRCSFEIDSRDLRNLYIFCK